MHFKLFIYQMVSATGVKGLLLLIGMNDGEIVERQRAFA